jgi:excisionase family DNA binding protein
VPNAPTRPQKEPCLVAAKPAALETGIPYTTLRDLAFNGKIPVVKIGRAWYFDRADLRNFSERSKEVIA